MNAPAAELARAAELTRLTAERDALAAENARLKVLAVNGEFYKDAETGQIYMANFHLLSKEEGRRRLAARGATFASEDAFLNASPDEAARALAGVEHLRVALDLAISLIEDCQRDLTTYLRPDGGLTKGDVISILLGRLDGPQWRAAAAARALVEAPR